MPSDNPCKALVPGGTVDDLVRCGIIDSQKATTFKGLNWCSDNHRKLVEAQRETREESRPVDRGTVGGIRSVGPSLDGGVVRPSQNGEGTRPKELPVEAGSVQVAPEAVRIPRGSSQETRTHNGVDSAKVTERFLRENAQPLIDEMLHRIGPRDNGAVYVVLLVRTMP